MLKLALYAVLSAILLSVAATSADARMRSHVRAAQSGLGDSGARPADGQLWAETRIAVAYWQEQRATVEPLVTDRGYGWCAEVRPAIAHAPSDITLGGVKFPDVAAWSTVGSCAIAITPKLAAMSRDYRPDYDQLRDECGKVTHEAGHAFGLVHEDQDAFPIMGEFYWDEAIPPACGSWAEKVVRVYRARHRA